MVSNAQDLQQLAAQPTSSRGAGDQTLRTTSHQDVRHVRRFSAGAPDPVGGWAGAAGQQRPNAAGFQRQALAGLAPLSWPSPGGSMSGADGQQPPAEVVRRSSGLTPGQEVRSAGL